jgi:PTH1 family peptidyl-tRNA hydrolase
VNDADEKQPHNQAAAKSTSPLEPPPKPPPQTIPSAIIGLGNPGGRYANTRHNAGFMVLDELARRQQVTFREQRDFHETKVSGVNVNGFNVSGVVLVKPQTFMNASGKVVQRYATKHKHLLVVHDDLDLPLGRMRFKFGGSAGGQRGIQDSINRIGKDFYRLKVGISRPPTGWAVERWVLSRFATEEKDLLEQTITTAADALEFALEHGIERAMGEFNGRDLRPLR